MTDVPYRIWVPTAIIVLIIGLLAQTNFLNDIGVPAWQTALFVVAVLAILALLFTLNASSTGHVSRYMTAVIIVCTLVDAYFTYQGVKEYVSGSPTKVTVTALLVATVGVALFTFGYWRLASLIGFVDTPGRVAVFTGLLFSLMTAQVVISVVFNVLALTGSTPFLQNMQRIEVPEFVTYANRVDQQYVLAEQALGELHGQVIAWRQLAEAEAEGAITGKKGRGPEYQGLIAQTKNSQQAVEQLTSGLAEAQNRLQLAKKDKAKWTGYLRGPAAGKTWKEASALRGDALDAYRQVQAYNTEDLTRIAEDINSQVKDYASQLRPKATTSGSVLVDQFVRRVNTSGKNISDRTSKISALQTNADGTKISSPTFTEETKMSLILSNLLDFLPNIGFAFFISWSAAMMVFFGVMQSWQDPTSSEKEGVGND